MVLAMSGGAPGSALPRLRANVEDALDRGDGREDRDEPEGAAKDRRTARRGEFTEPGDAGVLEADRGRHGPDARQSRGDEADREDRDAHLARGHAYGGQAGAGRGGETLGLRPNVAHHERRTHRRRREDGSLWEPGGNAAPGDPDKDDAPAPAVEGRVEERPEARGRTGRAGERAIEQIEDAEDGQQDPGDDPRVRARGDGREARPRDPDQGQGIRCQTEATQADRHGRRKSANALAELGRDEGAGHEVACLARGPRPRTWRSWTANASNASGTRRDTESRPARRVSTRPASRSRARGHETRGWLSPTWPLRSETG